jgi:hypothetical protein
MKTIHHFLHLSLFLSLSLSLSLFLSLSLSFFLSLSLSLSLGDTVKKTRKLQTTLFVPLGGNVDNFDAVWVQQFKRLNPVLEKLGKVV